MAHLGGDGMVGIAKPSDFKGKTAKEISVDSAVTLSHLVKSLEKSQKQNEKDHETLFSKVDDIWVFLHRCAWMAVGLMVTIIGALIGAVFVLMQML